MPQRIRAGCDPTIVSSELTSGLCLSAFVRVATKYEHHSKPSKALCLSAFVRVATRENRRPPKGKQTLPQRIRAGCDNTLICGIVHRALCLSAFVRVATAEKQCSALRICCEKVDSFSSVGESGLALTIFPFSFAAKATYVAINDSFGRAIDRFFWCEPHRN